MLLLERLMGDPVSIRDIGQVINSRQGPVTTSFENDGIIAASSPLRLAYRHVLPTTLGWLAGSVRLLRMPHVVCALSPVLSRGRSITGHLLAIYGAQMAATFGDTQTFKAVQLYMRQQHARNVPADEQPDWFAATVGRRSDFVPGERKLQTGVAASLGGAVLRAHRLCGLLQSGSGGSYAYNLAATLGAISGAYVPPSASMLLRLESACNHLPLMTAEQVREAGVHALLAEVLAAEVLPGTTVLSLAHLFVGLISPADRNVFSLSWTTEDKQKFNEWCNNYSQQNNRWLARESGVTTSTPLPTDGVDLTDEHFFTIALRSAERPRTP